MSNPMKRAVFLDRDGVINKAVVINGKPYPPANLDAMELIPYVSEGLDILSKEGYLLIVITNQPDVARKKLSRHSVEEIHTYLGHCLPITEFKTCYHSDEHHCDCRKPAPGALLSAAKKYTIDLSKSYMIGDRWRDIEAGEQAGCQTIFIDYAYAEKQPTTMNFRVQTFKEAVHIILGRNLDVQINQRIKN